MSGSAVISDFGGVLLKISFDRAVNAWAAHCGADPESLRECFSFDAAFAAFEINALTPVEYLSHLRRVLGVEISDALLSAGWNEIYIGIDHEVADVFRELRDAGVRVIGVTNTNLVHYAHWSVRFADGVRSFDALYSSTELHSRKPEARFFSKVLAAEGLDRHDVVFFDDIAENVEGAARYGIRSHLYESPSQMRAVLSDAGYPCRASGAGGGAPTEGPG